MLRENIKGFFEFVRKQGVMTLAVGFLLAGAVNKVVTALVNDLINPLLGLVMGGPATLREYKWRVGEAEILWGDFLAVTIDFLIIAMVIYFVMVKLFKIEVGKK